MRFTQCKTHLIFKIEEYFSLIFHLATAITKVLSDMTWQIFQDQFLIERPQFYQKVI